MSLLSVSEMINVALVSVVIMGGVSQMGGMEIMAVMARREIAVIMITGVVVT